VEGACCQFQCGDLSQMLVGDLPKIGWQHTDNAKTHIKDSLNGGRLGDELPNLSQGAD